MDFFNGRYYKGIKVLMCLVGRWPYQSFKQRALISSMVIVFWSYYLFHRMLVLNHYDNYSSQQEVILESLSPLFVDCICITKYVTITVKKETITALLERIKENWNIYSVGEEKKILEYYSHSGKLLSIGYVGAVYLVTVLFLSEPIVEQTYFKIFENTTIPKRLSAPAYWEKPDFQENYYYFISYQIIFCNCILTITCASDAMFIAFLQHVIGLFSITGYLLKNIPIEDIIKQNELKTMKDVAYDHYVKCMKSHKRALDFAEKLESIYVWSFGILMGINIPLISITAMQLVTNTENIIKSLKYGSFVGIQLLHLYFYCFLSQKLLNSSLLIPECAMSGKWYLCSVKAQRLATMIMMRSQNPCQLSAGKVFIMSMETFTSIIKTCGSYFTMLVQMQNS